MARADVKPTDHRPALPLVGRPEWSFETRFEQAMPAIGHLVTRLLGWSNDAPDVTQDALAAAWRRRSTFRGDSTLETWLTRIAINHCRSHIRRQRLRRALFLTSSAEEAASVAATPDDRLDDEEVQSVTQAIRNLNPRDREVIVLRYLEDRTTREIATLLGTTINVVDKRISRARARLRPQLGHLAERFE